MFKQYMVLCQHNLRYANKTYIILIPVSLRAASTTTRVVPDGTSKSVGPEIMYFRVWIYLDRDPQSASIVPRNPDGTKHECPRP